MFSILDYYYFRFFKLGKAISFGLQWPQYKSAALSSTMTYLLVLCLLEHTRFGITKDSAWIHFGFWLTWFILNIQFFMRPKNYRRALRRYSENYILSLLLNILTGLIVIGSVLLFARLKLN